MVSVTVLNATRMLAIEAASIVDGSVNGSGNLVLTTQGGSTIVAGHVRGATGPTGPAGATGPQGAQGIQGIPGTPAPTITDTGWVNLTYASGFIAGSAGQLQYRVRDGIIFFRGGAEGTFTAGTYHVVTPVGAIPLAYRPPVNHRGGCMGQAIRPCGFEINTDGSVKLGTNGLSSMPPWIALLTSYPL